MTQDSILLQGGFVVDGTGCHPFRADLRITGKMITQIGPDLPPLPSDRVISAKGLYICPGFIDAHCHTDMYASAVPDACGKVMQGVTTDVCGLCGDSPAPIGLGHLEQFRQLREYQLPGEPELESCTFADYRTKMERCGNSTNMALFVGNTNLRVHAVGYENRPATSKELACMQDMLVQSVRDGAFGLSTGLTYLPSMFSSTEELISLCRSIAPMGGIYNSHMRNESDHVLQAIQEVIAIIRESGCRGHISHLKVSGKRNHGLAQRCLELIHQANDQGLDLSFDAYPYTAGSCGLRTLLPPEILSKGLDFSSAVLLAPHTLGEIRRRLNDSDWDNLLLSCGPDGITLSSGYHPCNGQTLLEISQQWNMDVPETIARLLCLTQGQGSIIYHALSREDLTCFLSDPLCSIGTDAFARNYSGPTAAGCPHPRNYGAFPRWLEHYVLGEHLCTLEEGIRKITSLPAQQFGLEHRGILREGYFADITVFDPHTIRERGDFLHPAQAPDGIRMVLVRGRIAADNGTFLPVRNGTVLSHKLP